MAQIVQNSDVPTLGKTARRQAYNCLDTCLTLEIFNKIHPQLDPLAQRVYNFERALQQPTMAMQLRGMRVDEEVCAEGREQLEKEIENADHEFAKATEDLVGWACNIQSPAQLIQLFYNKAETVSCSICNGQGEVDTGLVFKAGPRKGQTKTRKCPELKNHQIPGLALKPIKDKDGKLTTGIKAMENIIKRSQEGSPPYVAAVAVLDHRAIKKQLDDLNAKRHPNGRMRYSINVGATETFRLSSSQDCYKRGVNIQNRRKRWRNIFVPDPSYLMCNIDLEQGESHCVAYLANDPAYIEAHDGPENTHLAVARLIWPEWDWVGDEEKDLAYCKEPGYYRYLTRYDLSKRVQHSINYYGSKYTVSQTLGISQTEAQDIINRYLKAFPGIPAWHKSIGKQLKETGEIIAPMEYRRQFFGRPNDQATLREAIAHVPQSLVAMITNIGVLRIWKELDDGDPLRPGTGNLELLMQGHDAVLFQFRNLLKEGSRIKHNMAPVTNLMRVEVPMPGGTMVIGTDCKVGNNWKEVS